MVEQQDIGEELQKTMALQERLKTIPGSLLCFGPSGRVEAHNPKTLEDFFSGERTLALGGRLTGVEIKDLIGFSEEERSELEEALKEARENEKQEVFIGDVNAKEEARVLRASFTPLDEKGNMVLTVEEATAEVREKVKEDPEIEALIGAEKRDSGEEIVATLWHEIDEPLTVIENHLKRPWNNTEDEEFVREVVEDIESAAKRIRGIIEQLDERLEMSLPPLTDCLEKMMIDIHSEEEPGAEKALTLEKIGEDKRAAIARDPKIKALIAAERWERRGQIRRTVEHEINNALTPVLGNAQYLLGKEGLSSQDRENLKKIEEESKRIAHVTKRLDELLEMRRPPLTEYGDGSKRMMIDISSREGSEE